MLKPIILVSGATGKTGATTIEQLLTKGYPVRALARRADSRSERLRKLGAEVVIGPRGHGAPCSTSRAKRSSVRFFEAASDQSLIPGFPAYWMASTPPRGRNLSVPSASRICGRARWHVMLQSRCSLHASAATEGHENPC